MSQTVLLLESDSSRYERLAFLVRLAGYAHHRITSIDEALNWRKTFGRGGCLLVGSTGPAENLAQFLRHAHECQSELPILFIDRVPPAVIQLAASPLQLYGSNVFICTPTEISAALGVILPPQAAPPPLQPAGYPREVRA